MIPQGFITSLLDRADIVDVVGRYVTLKKSGRNFMACCPFHKEKTPSFSVSPGKQLFKCFGCGKAGNAIGFLMEIEHLEFPEAVRKLAGFYGMEVPEDRSPRRREEMAKARSLTDLMKAAADFYTLQLKSSEKTIAYLKKREISGETAARFGLGYAPEGWHSLQAVFPEKHYQEKALLEVGLVNEKNGRRYDAFRGRLMFPIRNPKGQVIGFGARTLNGDEQPKYLNSPETPIYHKGSELYGLYEGRDAVTAKDRAIVCEGYMDVIQLSQAGFAEAVAALGTSITAEHVKKLFKLADHIYFSFDGDAAGRKAARRALEAALPVISDTQTANFVLLPPEHDPDSLIKAEGAAGYEKELERSMPLTAFVKSLVTEGKDLAYAEERASLLAEAKPWVLQMTQAPILRLALIKELAALARMQTEEVLASYGLMPARPALRPRASGSPDFPRRSGFPGGQNRPWTSFERSRWRTGGSNFSGAWRYAPPEPRVGVKDIRDRMLQCFLSYPALLTEFSPQIEEMFLTSEHPAAQRIVAAWRAAAREEEETGSAVKPASLLAAMSSDGSEGSSAFCEALLSDELLTETPLEAARLELRRAFLDLESEHLKTRMAELADAGAHDLELMKRLQARRTELDRAIAEAARDELAYRRGQQSSSLEQQTGKSAPAALSKNPKVRALQEMLFGRQRQEDASDAVSAEEDDAPIEIVPSSSAALPASPVASPFGTPPVASPFGAPPPSTPFGAPPGAAAARAPAAAPEGRSPAASAARRQRDEILAALMAQAKKNAAAAGVDVARFEGFDAQAPKEAPSDWPAVDDAMAFADETDAFDAGPVPEGFADAPAFSDEEAADLEAQAQAAEAAAQEAELADKTRALRRR